MFPTSDTAFLFGKFSSVFPSGKSFGQREIWSDTLWGKTQILGRGGGGGPSATCPPRIHMDWLGIEFRNERPTTNRLSHCTLRDDNEHD